MGSIGEICERDVVVTRREATVAEAAKLMRDYHVGSLIVVDRSRGGLPVPLGIVTDRDIVIEVTAVGLDHDTITVSDIMPRELLTIRADEDALEAMRQMRRRGVRRLPVVNEDGRLLGIVTFDDLLDEITFELSELTRTVTREQAREASERR